MQPTPQNQVSSYMYIEFPGFGAASSAIHQALGTAVQILLMPELSAKDQKALKKQQKQAQRAAKKEASGPSAPVEAPKPVKTCLFGNLAPVHPLEKVSIEGCDPRVLQLAIKYQKCEIIGSSARVRAMLELFSSIVAEYQVPADGATSRSIGGYLNKQIEVLASGRALGVSMGNAIRWLKQQITALNPESSGDEAKENIKNLIDGYIRDQIEFAAKVIVDSAVQMIKPRARILTYGHSEVVYLTLKKAHEMGLDISVVVVDSNPLFEGKKLASKLADLGIPVEYALIHALPYLVDDTISCVMVGAHAMTSNGQLFSRVGTAMVAMAVSVREIPFLVLCETLKFSERVQLDSFTTNEIVPSGGPIEYVFYDLTDSKYISKVVTEIGALPASSVPVILREYKQLQ